MNNFKEDQKAAAEAVLIEQSNAVFERWLGKHPEVNYEAAKKIFQEYCDFTDPLSESDFDFAYGNIRDRISPKRVPTPEEVKAELIDKIMARLESTNNQHWQVPHNVQTERTKMSFWSVEQLAARLDEVVRAQTINAMPPAERKAIVESGRKYQGYPTLSKTIVRPGTVRAVTLDAAYLKGLDAWELKKFCRLYGVEQVNNRLAGKD